MSGFESPFERTLQDQQREAQEPVSIGVGPGGPSPFEALLQEDDDRRDRALMLSFESAVQANPDLAGKAQQLGIQTGLHPRLIEANIDKIRALTQRETLERLRIAKQSPILLQQLTNPEFARIAHDQIDGLSGIEALLRNFEVGQLTIEQGIVQERIFSVERPAPADVRRLEQIRRRLEELPARSSDIFTGMFKTVGMASMMARDVLDAAIAGASGGAVIGSAVPGAGTAAGALTGAGAGTLLGLWRTSQRAEAGNAYLEMVERGVSEDTAAQIAPWVGAVNATLEVGGFAAITAPAKRALTKAFRETVSEALTRRTTGEAALQFARSWVAGVGAEVGTELGQEIVNMLGEVAGGADPGNVGERLGDIFGETLRGVAILGGIGPAVQLHADLGRVAQAQADAQLFQQIVDAIRQTPVTKRSPDAMAGFVDRGVRGTRGETVYVEAERVAEVLEQQGVTQQQLENQLPQIARQLPQARATGGDVAISTGDFVARVAETDVGRALMQHARFDPDDYSAAEIDQVQEGAQALQQQTVEAVQRELTTTEQAREVEEGFRQQVAQTGRVGPKEAEAAAAVYRAFVETQALNLQVTPAQFQEQFQLHVEGLEDPVPAPTTQVPERAVEPAPEAEVQPGQVPPEAQPTEAPRRPEPTRRRPRAQFVPETMTIQLGQKANLTSVLHEMAHAFLHMYGQIASQPGVPVQVVADMQAFLDWRGIESLEAWNAMSLDEQRPHHEAFAESFEVYAFEGQAPSLELQSLFERFRRWITRLWRNIKDTIQGVDPTLKGVFDRMLASEAAIAQTEVVRGMQALFATQEQSGMTDEQWANYQAQGDEARAAAVAEVQQRSLRSMEWLSRAQGKKLQELQRQHSETRKQVQAEVRAELEAQPIFRALQFLRTGKLVTDTGTEIDFEGTHKLHTASVRELVPEGTDLRGLGLTSPDGMAPDQMAEIFGFGSGRELVQALLERPSLEDMVQERTDQRMLAEHGEMQDARQIQQKISAALHNPARARFTAAEIRALTRAGQPVRIMVSAAKEAARQTLLTMPVSQIKTWRFAAAERRANRAALDAASKGDTDAAVAAKRVELLQHEMASEAARIEREVERAENKFARFFQPDTEVGKRRNIDLVNTGRAILAWHGFRGEVSDPLSHLRQIEQYAPELVPEIEDIMARLTEDRTAYRDLSLDDFRLLDEGLDALWYRALHERQIRVGEQLELKDSIVDILLPIFNSRRPPGGPPTGRRLTPGERRRFNFGSLRAWIRHVESWAIQMDGGTTGPVHRYLYALLREPFDKYMLEKEQLVQPLAEAIDKLKFKDVQNIQAGQEGEFTHKFADKRELIGALLQAGNPSNLRRLLLGYQWVPDPEVAGGPINEAAWWNFVERMNREGVLTKADWDFVQSVWDTFEQLFPRSQQIHERIYGYRAAEIEAQAIDTPFGEYRGGYYPAEIDRVESRIRGRPLPDTGDDIIETSREARGRMPSTGRDFMKERTRHRPRPLRLDLRLIASALDDELRFIWLQEPGRDVLKLLRDPRLFEAINAVDPHAIDEMFLPWLRDTLQNRVMKSSGNPTMDAFLSGLRRNVGMAIMFANARVGLQQLTGLANSKAHMPLKFLRTGFRSWSESPRDTTAKVIEASDFMRDRLVFYAGQITDDADVLLGPEWMRAGQKWTKKHGHFLQRIFQMPVDVITWIGAYEHATAQKRPEVEAVRHADAIVRRSQSSGLAPDISRWERSSALVRTLTQFSTYWLATLNMILAKEGADRVQAIGLVLGLVGLGGAAIAKVLEGGFEDDDDDGTMWDEVASWTFSETAQTAFAVLPPPASAFLPAITGEFGGRISFGAAWGSAGNALRTFRNTFELTFDGDRELKSGDVRDAATLLSLMLGLPVTAVAKPLQYQVDVGRGKIEPGGAVDQIRGMVMGR